MVTAVLRRGSFDCSWAWTEVNDSSDPAAASSTNQRLGMVSSLSALPLFWSSALCRRTPKKGRQCPLLWRRCLDSMRSDGSRPRPGGQPSRTIHIPAMSTLAELCTAAHKHYEAGEWRQAEQLYRQVLRTDPYHAEAALQ